MEIGNKDSIIYNFVLSKNRVSSNVIESLKWKYEITRQTSIFS